MTLDLDRITHPLRLAGGSHQPGSGKGCAMNVISYINGDTEITDYPKCSARPLALLVQMCNDNLVSPGTGYLSPADSLLVLDLAWSTVGTSDVPVTVILSWIAELLDNPNWGIIRCTESDRIAEIVDSAEAYRKLARGVMVPLGCPVLDWCDKISVEESATWWARSAAARSNWAATRTGLPVDEFTRQAIACWRKLAGLDIPDDIQAENINDALARIQG